MFHAGECIAELASADCADHNVTQPTKKCLKISSHLNSQKVKFEKSNE